MRTPHPWPRRAVIAIAATVAVTLATPAAAVVPQNDPGVPPIVTPSRPQEVRSVNGRSAPLLPETSIPAVPTNQAAVDWPGKSVVDVMLPAMSGGSPRSALASDAPAGSLPIRVGRTGSSSPSKVRVRYHDGAISVRRIDGAVVRGPVRLTVDYSGFRDAYGGDWAARLRLVSRDGSAVGGVRNNARSRMVSADLPVDGTERTYALAAAPEGPAGDYKATSLSPSGKWQVSTHTGAFSWAYPLRTPPVPGDLAPELSVSYNSQSVDGRTASTNSQPSWLGEGWNLWPGFIERSYKGCAEDLDGNNGKTKTGDLCWETENATLSFGEKSGPLVLQGNGVWRPKDDDGTRVERLTGAANGDQGDGVAPAGEYWKVTTTDGTRYFFGRRADSAWTVPVFGNDGTEPCKRDTYDLSQCDQAYRWNLDYVVDPHGNSMSYFYREENNQYGANNAKRASSYTRGGTLDRIDYGTRDGAGGWAPARVLFEPADRCLSNCGVRNASTWPDVPWEQECTSGTCVGKSAPTFWSTKRLTKVTTQVSLGAGSYRNVDQWTFTHSFPPAAGSTAALWLTGITRTGLAATPSISLPPVTFEGTMEPNRVDSGPDGHPMLYKNRISSIKTESGGVISVNYVPTECVPGAPPPVDENIKRCFPVRWVPPMYSAPYEDWFHKYVVAKITETDAVGGNPPQVTNYGYVAGGAWAYDDDPLIELNKRTWSEWRGFEKVVVRRGQPGVDESKPQSWTHHQYFRGMHGDKLKAGGTKSLDIVDSRGVKIPDLEPFAGFRRETIVRNGIENGVLGPEVSAEIHTPWNRLTATQDALKAYQVEDTKVESRVRRLDGSYRNTQVDTTYDGYGNPLTVNDAGDLATGNDDRCTTTLYASAVGARLVNLPSEVKTVGVSCGSTPSLPADAITDTRSYYDDSDLGTALSKGNPTKTEVAKSYAGSTPAWLNDKRTVYDDHGRAHKSYDALGRETSTAYTEENGLTKTTTETNPKRHLTTTTLDPAWGLPVRVEDANNRVTSMKYDALGRLVEVWKPGRSQEAQDSGHLRFGYEVRKNGPSWVKSEKLNANQNHIASYTLLDGFLRERQTQAPSPQGGRIVADTLYDSRGLVNVKRAPYYNKDAAPGTTLFLPNAGEVPNATVKVYDGAERETDSIYVSLNTEQWRTRTYHGGDRVSVVPPQGGTATTTYVDARGRTTALLQHKTRPVSGPPGGAADRTSYGYTKRGDLASVTDPADNVWRYEYDVLGRKFRADDPDHGVSRMTYDDAGQLLTTTDARDKTVTAVYDELGRKTETWLGSTVLTKSVYDSPEKGALRSSTRYSGGQAYIRTVNEWDAAGRPSVETVAIPAIEKELAGSYQTKTTYAVDGSPFQTTLPALGDLPAEVLTHGYDDLGLPDTLEGAHPAVPDDPVTYVANTTYTALAEPTQTEHGAEGKRIWRTSYYQDGTRRPERLLTEREKVDGIMVHELTYGYDQVGNVTRIGDRTAGQDPDTQCFRYDYLRRAAEAWTATDGCAAAPSTTVIGGPAPYWHQFGYDITGNRTSQTRKSLGAAADVVSTYTYPTPGDGVDRPHGVTSIRTGTKTDVYSYDAVGNTAGRPGPAGPQTLDWDAEGLLESVSSAARSTQYVYDGEGKQLLRRDNGSVTLFLGSGEVKLDTTTRVKTGSRYYEGLGARSKAALTWTVADHHGTPQVAVDSSSLAATPRRLDLFGNPRGGSVGTAASWPGGDRGFVGGTPNDATGLTRLGAREYDPALGKFLSVDPLTDTKEPQQMNAYSYSVNNPATLSDPDGLIAVYDDERHWNVGAPVSMRAKMGRPCGPPSLCGPFGNYLPPKWKPPVRKGTKPTSQRPNYPRAGNSCYPKCPPKRVRMQTTPNGGPRRSPCLTPQLGGCGGGIALRRLNDWFLQQHMNSGLFKLTQMLTGGGGSVSVCGSATGAFSYAAGVHACVSFDDRGVGGGAGNHHGSGAAMGGEAEVEVKVSTARVDELSGGKTFYTRGHMTYSVSDKGDVSYALSVLHKGHIAGDYAGRQHYESEYLFTWTEFADWWHRTPDMSGGGVCGGYNNC